MSGDLPTAGRGVIFCAASPPLDELHRSGWAVVRVIAGERVHDHASLVDALAAALPLDPPLGGGGSWDALADSLFGGIDALRAGRVALVWPAAWRMRRGSPREFETALDVLRQTVDTVCEARYTAGRPTELLVLVEADGPP